MTDTQNLVKLNLGCGDKHLPGYLNVDIVESRRGLRPDVICDIRDLKPFDGASVDEVLAVHVIEHVHRWEVEGVLVEWARVLKSGGKIVLETPNLISACKALLEDPIKGARPGQEGQMTMWPLYGDPSWKDEHMMHKWLYTPRSLAEVLHKVGFTQIKQTPAQYKMREPRDMRLEAIKP
jgi:predicted SAM-dependent methyltransferase